jgi:hypothetical protein
MLREHYAGDADHRKPLWTLLVFQLWREQKLALKPAVRTAHPPVRVSA